MKHAEKGIAIYAIVSLAAQPGFSSVSDFEEGILLKFAGSAGIRIMSDLITTLQEAQADLKVVVDK